MCGAHFLMVFILLLFQHNDHAGQCYCDADCWATGRYAPHARCFNFLIDSDRIAGNSGCTVGTSLLSFKSIYILKNRMGQRVWVFLTWAIARSLKIFVSFLNIVHSSRNGPFLESTPSKGGYHPEYAPRLYYCVRGIFLGEKEIRVIIKFFSSEAW